MIDYLELTNTQGLIEVMKISVGILKEWRESKRSGFGWKKHIDRTSYNSKVIFATLTNDNDAWTKH